MAVPQTEKRLYLHERAAVFSTGLYYEKCSSETGSITIDSYFLVLLVPLKYFRPKRMQK